ncbi:hypothetical protein [Haematospirillum sp. H1815]|nr:hypothetical protein [Haematospirillum sp. H1815]
MMRFLLAVLLLSLVGGAVFLATWDMPPPRVSFEKVVRSERVTG